MSVRGIHSVSRYSSNQDTMRSHARPIGFSIQAFGFVSISTLAWAPLRSGRSPSALLASSLSAMRTGKRCGSRSQPDCDWTSGRVPTGASSPPLVTPQPTLSTLSVEHAARQQIEGHANRIARRDPAELVLA